MAQPTQWFNWPPVWEVTEVADYPTFEEIVRTAKHSAAYWMVGGFYVVRMEEAERYYTYSWEPGCEADYDRALRETERVVAMYSHPRGYWMREK